jgi:hypothetical protein
MHKQSLQRIAGVLTIILLWLIIISIALRNTKKAGSYNERNVPIQFIMDLGLPKSKNSAPNNCHRSTWDAKEYIGEKVFKNNKHTDNLQPTEQSNQHVIQLGVFCKGDKVLNIVQVLEIYGYHCLVIKENIDGRLLHWLFVGRGLKKETLQNMLGSLKELTGLKGVIVREQILQNKLNTAY